MLAWLRNVNIAILVSHVSWNVLISSTLVAQPCTCTITLNGHAHISNLHCQFLCCCALLLHVETSLKTHPSHYLSQWFSHSLILKVNKVKGLAGPFTMWLISTRSSKPFLLASGLPEVTALPGHLNLSSWPQGFRRRPLYWSRGTYPWLLPVTPPGHPW